MTEKESASFSDLVEQAEAEESARPGLPLSRAWAELELADIRKDLVRRLSAAGIGEAEIETRHLLAHVLAPAPLAQALADPALVSWRSIADLADLAVRRLERVPLSQVLGEQPFWTLDLAVTCDVLTPRADTETLVETALELAPREGVRVLDLGTGSGAILLALLAERPGWTGLGVDLSAEALAVAQGNADRSGLAERARFARGRWGDGLAEAGFDLIVSNPPYIRAAEIETLAPEVRDHEPRLALDGGPDGLDAYRELAPEIKRLLRPGGGFALEIGWDQAEAVSALARAAGLCVEGVRRDLAGRDRVICGRAD